MRAFAYLFPGQGSQSLLRYLPAQHTDFAFAAIMGLWLQPDGYGGGRADEVRIERDRCPAPMIGEIERWEESQPLSTAFVKQLYANWRRPGG